MASLTWPWVGILGNHRARGMALRGAIARGWSLAVCLIGRLAKALWLLLLLRLLLHRWLCILLILGIWIRLLLLPLLLLLRLLLISLLRLLIGLL